MSLRNGFLIWALRHSIKPGSLVGQSIAASRARTERVPFRARLPKDWHVRVTHEQPLIGEWIEPKQPDKPPRDYCILYLHGGAYIAMSARTHRAITSRLAWWSGARLFALNYRLAPEHPFPAALEDALSAWHALIAQGTPPSRIVLAGDSAGGGLALALLVALRESGHPLPAAAVLFSPWTDLAATGGSIVTNDFADPLFFGSWIAPAARFYLNGAPATDPLASPLYADMTSFPPLHIHVGSTEVLLDDSRRIADRVTESGGSVCLRVFWKVPHGWQIFAPVLPEARDSLRDASRFIAARLARSERVHSSKP